LHLILLPFWCFDAALRSSSKSWYLR